MLDNIKINSTIITVVLALAVGIPYVVQVIKVRLRQLIEIMPDGRARDRAIWWSRSWGPVVATVLMWVAGAATMLLPLISDGDLSLTEIITVLGVTGACGTAISNIIHKASKLTRDKNEVP